MFHGSDHFMWTKWISFDQLISMQSFVHIRQRLWSAVHDTNTSFPSELVLNPKPYSNEAGLHRSYIFPPNRSPKGTSNKCSSKVRVSVQGSVLDAQNYFNEAGMQWPIYFTRSQSQRSSQHKYSSKTTWPRLLYSQGNRKFFKISWQRIYTCWSTKF